MRIILLLPFLALILQTTKSAGQSGTLDESFGNGGEVATTAGSNSIINSIALQTDGKIIAAGSDDLGFTLARYKTNGNLDSTFGNNGIVITGFTSNGNGAGEGKSVQLQADGKIIVGGSIDSFLVKDEFYRYEHFALVRYLPSGKIDSSFGINGKVITVLVSENNNEIINSIIIGDDGKIIAAGSHWNNSYKIQDFAMVRYLPNGKVDSSFGNKGIVLSTFSNNSSTENAVSIDSKNRLIIAGIVTIGSKEYFGFVRYNKNGKIDSAFGSNGFVIIDFNDRILVSPNSVIILPDGKIIGGGYTGRSISDTLSFTLVRCLSNGQIDSSFGINGIEITDFPLWMQSRINSIALQSDGKILASGFVANGLNSSIALARYHSNGKLDLSFGNNGEIVTDFNGTGGGANAIAIQKDARILVAGYQGNYLNAIGFALARYYGTEHLQKTITDFKPNSFVSTSAIKLYPDPAKDVLNISLSASQNEKAQIQIVDVNGKIALNQNVNLAAGKSTQTINISKLVKGIYFVRIKTNEGETTEKFVKE